MLCFGARELLGCLLCQGHCLLEQVRACTAGAVRGYRVRVARAPSQSDSEVLPVWLVVLPQVQGRQKGELGAGL